MLILNSPQYFAMQQTGQIEIVEVAEQETFQVLTFTGTIPSRGLRVKIQFSGQMATYLPPIDFPTYAGDSELVAGEASLYVAFWWGNSLPLPLKHQFYPRFHRFHHK